MTVTPITAEPSKASPAMPASILTSDRFPPAAAARVCAKLLNRHSAHEIACAIEVLIDLRDLIEGDPDAESHALEDDFTPMPADIDFGPGCSIADPGEAEEDMGEEERGENRTWSNSIDQRLLSEGCFTFAAHDDDAEDDDPAGQCDEDACNTAAPHNFSGPGCYISDPAEGEFAL
jgi:hypothetical protein